VSNFIKNLTDVMKRVHCGIEEVSTEQLITNIKHIGPTMTSETHPSPLMEAFYLEMSVQ